MSDITSDFLSAIRQHGLSTPERIIADDKIHRFRSGPEHGLNGFYQLSIVPAYKGGDIGFGLIGCWKRDINEKWCSREPGSVTERDRSAMERVREEQRKAVAEAAKEAAKKAEWIWKEAKPARPDHPYLQAKGIGPRGLKEYKDMLVVPIYRQGKLASLQFIGADGVKKFVKGGEIEGGYASLSGGSTRRDRVIIAEGFATAASLFEVTGLPVVIAFNAGNLLSVAKAIRGKYPDAELVIAGDNDQWTVVRGEAVNVGVERAEAAAESVGATLKIPEFPHDDPDKATDWNDYAKRHGKEATLRSFNGESKEETPGNMLPETQNGRSPPQPDQSSPPQEPAYLSDWRGRLIQGKEVAEGHPFPFEGKSKTNAYLFLKNHHRFEGLLCYNEFTDSIMLMRRPPWEDDIRFSPRPIRDDDFFMLAANLEYCDISVSKDTAADAAIRVAKECSINPPREYLSRLEWDGVGRLDKWLTYYLGADEQPAEYLALVGAKWLIGAVSRVFEPGCKFDSVLILEGSQGLGKSMALRSLATFGGQDFFLDSVGDIRSKDTLMTMQGKLIVEIAELASFRKTENEEIKAFISRQIDEYRPPYGRTVTKRPRYFVLGASTNEMDGDGYLTDPTGGRRYWPVKCKSIDVESIARDAPQLWAEAVSRYRKGERTWLAAEEVFYSAQEQRQRFVEDAWQERIATIVKHEWSVRVDDILGKLELKPKDINNMVKNRVKNSLRQLGWVETRRAGEGRLWRPADRLAVAEAD